MLVYSKKQVQIETKIKIRALLFNKTLIIILTEYCNFSDIFLAKYLMKLLDHTKINDHVIKLQKSK